MTISSDATRGYMTASEAIALCRHGLKDDLGLAMAGQHEAKPGESERTGRILAAMYRAAARMAPGGDTLPDEVSDEQTAGFPAEDKRAFALMLKGYAPQRPAGRQAREVLEDIGAPSNGAIVADARVQLLMGRAEAQARAAAASKSGSRPAPRPRYGRMPPTGFRCCWPTASCRARKRAAWNARVSCSMWRSRSWRSSGT